MGTHRVKHKIDYKKLNAEKKFCNEEVLADVAEELDLSLDVVRDIVDAQSAFTARTMKAGGMETIMYVYLGKFKVGLYQVQKMMANAMTK